jgi:hypothetical protein
MLLARMSCELLGDPNALARRRSLADQALRLARHAKDGAVLAEVLDARLYALWDPAGAEDRLETAASLIQLGRAAGDGAREGQPLGLDGRGRHIRYRLIHLFEFRGGLIDRELGIADVASILAQLPAAD